MFTSFSTALSALNATSEAVNVVGANLANLNTTGYKAESVQFSDLVSQALGAGSANSQVGLGVGSARAVRQFTQGSIQQSGGAFDCAIQGKGFFVVHGQNGQTLYTRCGNFSLNSDGYLQTAGGDKVQGWNAQAAQIDTNTATGDIRVGLNGSTPAQAAKNLSLTVNLNAAGETGQTSGKFSAPIQVVDSLGGTHTLTVNFTKTGANAWSYDVTIPASDLGAGAATTLASGALGFSSSGELASPAATADPIAVKATGLANGAADLDIKWSLFQDGKSLLTQYAAASDLSASSQDGFGAGQITNLELSDGGLIQATYSNGQKTTVGQLALASISNPETLSAVGANNLEATPATGDVAIGAAGASGRGKIYGGSLEASTVDIASEFTNLISYQRTYQANSRVISTTDQMTQELIGLIR